jgi:aspartyl protease family protein
LHSTTFVIRYHRVVAAATLVLAVPMLCCPRAASAADVSVVGLLPNRAIIVVDGSTPHVMAPGTQFQGVRLVSVSNDTATLQIDGRNQVLGLGQFYGSKSGDANQSITLMAASGGHFVTQGFIDNRTVTFLVDTGATYVTLSSDDARRLGIEFEGAPSGSMLTANGPTTGYKVTLDSVKVGSITINQVDAVIIKNGYIGPALLGMSFLARTQMTNEGDRLTLVKRY